MRRRQGVRRGTEDEQRRRGGEDERKKGGQEDWRRRGGKTGGAEERRGLEEEGRGEQEGEVSRRGLEGEEGTSSTRCRLHWLTLQYTNQFPRRTGPKRVHFYNNL